MFYHKTPPRPSPLPKGGNASQTESVSKLIDKHRDAETQRHRDTETQRHRDTETQRHRDTETQRHRGKTGIKKISLCINL